VLAKLAEQGSTPIKSNPDDFKKVIDAEIVKWGDLIKMAGARVD
jgi:tripartite-type tricarboxylate transporter receptor subunit TctC